MTTPYDIITRAMKDIGALAAGENPTADERKKRLIVANFIAQTTANSVALINN